MDPRALILLNSPNNDRAWRATETEGQNFDLWQLDEWPAWFRLLSLPQDVVLELSWF